MGGHKTPGAPCGHGAGTKDLALHVRHPSLGGAELADRTGLHPAFPYALLDLSDHQIRKLLLARGVYVVGKKGLLVEACAYEDVDSAGPGNIHDIVHIAAHAQVRDLEHIAHPQLLQRTELLYRLVLAVQTAVGVLLDP